MSQRGIIYLIGFVATGLAALGRYGGLYRGWEILCQNALHLNSQASIIPLWLEIVCAGLFALGSAFVGMQVTAFRFRLGLFFAILLQPVSAMAIGALAGAWISPLTWLVSILATVCGILGYRMTNAGKKERKLRHVFGKHLSQGAIDRLFPQPDALAAKSSQATVLSARYLGNDRGLVEFFTQNLQRQFAWAEQQTGNRLLAVWDLPLALPNASENAVEAALEMGKEWQIGLATGAVCGELSESGKWQMHGAAFEKADLLCQANTTFGSQILMDIGTADLARESFILRPVDFLVLPTHEMGVEIFEPLELTKTASENLVAQRDHFWEAVIYFRQKRFSEALASFQKSGDDAVVQYYLRQLKKLTSSY